MTIDFPAFLIFFERNLGFTVLLTQGEQQREREKQAPLVSREFDAGLDPRILRS